MEPVTDMVCRWDAPGCAGSLFLNVSTIRELRSQAIDAFVSLPKRGVEIGGLLFGREQDGHLFIQGFEEVTCEHRYGPSFVLSARDRAQLSERLDPGRSDDWLPVIGFYRSYTGRKAVLETAELALLREHFPNGPFVFLLLQPLAAQSCNAGFRLCRDGELLTEPPYTPVPFDPELLNSGAIVAPVVPVDMDPVDQDPVAVDAEPEPEMAIQEAPVEEVPEREARFPLFAPVLDRPMLDRPLLDPPMLDPPVVDPPRLPPPYRSLAPKRVGPDAPVRARPRWWLLILACLLAGVGGAGVYELWVLASQPRWVELNLDAKPTADGRSLAVTWDATAPKSIGATHALLGITDGSENRDVPLSLAEVQIGRYLYTPAHPDLSFRLILYGKGPALSGSALRLAPSPSLVHTPVAPVEPAGASRAPAPAPVAPLPPAGPRRPVHEVQPRIPAGIRARLRERVEIPVDVKIDGKGRVTAASTPPSADGLRRYLAGEAVKAARQWRFTAARAGTAPIAEKTISFSFAP
jgi:hypothetical protein